VRAGDTTRLLAVQYVGIWPQSPSYVHASVDNCLNVEVGCIVVCLDPDALLRIARFFRDVLVIPSLPKTPTLTSISASASTPSAQVKTRNPSPLAATRARAKSAVTKLVTQAPPGAAASHVMWSVKTHFDSLCLCIDFERQPIMKLTANEIPITFLGSIFFLSSFKPRKIVERNCTDTPTLELLAPRWGI